jgi:hypothetical protein
MQNDRQWRFADAMNWRPSTSRGPRRIVVAVAPTAINAMRTSAAGVVDGSGDPNDTVTGYGRRAGHLPKKRPPLKLNTLPQTRSR